MSFRPHVALILISLQASNQAHTQSGQWHTRAAMLTPRQEISPAALNGKIYIPGGFGPNLEATTLVEMFDPATNTWSTVAPLPEPLHHYGFAAAGGRLYLLGGYTGNTFTPTNRCYAYLPDSNVWRSRAELPVARGAGSAVEFGGKIYLFGGITNVDDSQRTDLYDPQRNTWTNLAAMPTAREHLAAARIDSLIYVVGGRIGTTNNNILEAYSPATNRWYTKAPMPTARGGLAASALRGRLYVFGGEIPGVFPQNEEYNPVTNTWRAMAPMQTPRHGTGAVTVGDSVFVIGGATQQGFGVSGVNEMFHIQPEISLVRPAGGDTLIVGLIDSIVWNSTPQIDTVRLEYSTAGVWNVIAAGIPASPNVFRYRVFGPTINGRFRVSWKSNPLVNDFTDPPFVSLARYDTGWTTQSLPTTSTLYTVKAVNASVGWACGGAGTVIRTTDGGSTWTSVGGGVLGNSDVYTMDALDANVALVSSSPSSTFIYRTTNGGVSWTQVFSQSGGFISVILMLNQTIGCAIGDPVAGELTVLKTTNSGASWQRIPFPSIGTEGVWSNGACKAGETHIWFLTSANRLYRTKDAGVAWNYSNVPATSARTVWFNDTLHGVIGGTFGQVYRSSDGGLTWTASTPFGTGAIPVVAGSGGSEFWASTQSGIFRSVDYGTSWFISFARGAGHMSFTSQPFVAGWATIGGGVMARYERRTVEVEPKEDMPLNFTLLQNYPNPFNPSTTFEYKLPRTDYVKVSVFNVLGEEVRTLVNETQDAGVHRIQFNAEGLPSGIYLYRIQTPHFVAVRKMLLLK